MVEDPYGLGASKINSKFSITSPYSQRQVPLRHYRADKRPGIKFQWPESEKLRAIYYYDKSHPDTVVLIKIIPHDEFDRAYAP